jgi:hypothetical protein
MDFHIKTDTTDDETWPLVPTVDIIGVGRVPKHVETSERVRRQSRSRLE